MTSNQEGTELLLVRRQFTQHRKKKSREDAMLGEALYSSTFVHFPFS